MATIKNFIPLREFKYNPDRLNVMSSGGGTQSNALICMMHAGIIPKSDIIVMSDTEREASNVFEYQRKYIQPLCDDMGVKYEIMKLFLNLVMQHMIYMPLMVIFCRVILV